MVKAVFHFDNLTICKSAFFLYLLFVTILISYRYEIFSLFGIVFVNKNNNKYK